MNLADAVPIVLLLLFGVAIGIGGTIVLLAWRWHRHSVSFLGSTGRADHRRVESLHLRSLAKRPTIWLAIRSGDPAQVLNALSLNDPTPCSWNEGILGENKLFIAPPVRGWVLVVGTAVPDPADDVDACFRFLRELGRRLGHVQFFCADRVLHHHAWARIEAGRVVRAYAWAGLTLWDQGVKTTAESELGLKIFGYGEDVASARWGTTELLAANVEKVPLLAARWSLDPAEIVEHMPPHAQGIAGRPSVRY